MADFTLTQPFDAPSEPIVLPAVASVPVPALGPAAPAQPAAPTLAPAPAPVSLEQLSYKQLQQELGKHNHREMGVSLTKAAFVLRAALAHCRAGLSPAAFVIPTETPAPAAGDADGSTNFSQTDHARLALVMHSGRLQREISRACNGDTRQNQDAKEAKLFTKMVELMADPTFPSVEEDLAAAAKVQHCSELRELLNDAIWNESTWDAKKLKDAFRNVKRVFSIVYGRWSASGQGDPDAPITNFIHAGDTHHKIVELWFYFFSKEPAILPICHRVAAVGFDTATDGAQPLPPSEQPVGTRRRSFLQTASEDQMRSLFKDEAKDGYYRTERLLKYGNLVGQNILTVQQECDLQNAIDVDIASLCKRPNVDQFAAQPPTDLGADEPDDTTTTDGSDEDDALGPRRMSANSRAAFNSNASNPLQPPAFSGFGGPAAGTASASE